MSERRRSYWVGNVTPADFSRKVFKTGPDESIPSYLGYGNEPASAEIVKFRDSAHPKPGDTNR